MVREEEDAGSGEDGGDEGIDLILLIPPAKDFDQAEASQVSSSLTFA